MRRWVTPLASTRTLVPPMVWLFCPTAITVYVPVGLSGTVTVIAAAPEKVPRASAVALPSGSTPESQ